MFLCVAELTFVKFLVEAAEREKLIEKLTAEMREAARMLEFEKAAFLRDRIKDLKTTK